MLTRRALFAVAAACAATLDAPRAPAAIPPGIAVMPSRSTT